MKETDDIDYIGSLARELCRLALQARRPFLAYLLSLVIAETEQR